ncbi:MAG: acyl-CoA thioesterase II [Alphaproteobacteria bacterium]
MADPETLKDLLDLEVVEPNLFRGLSINLGYDPRRIFGGQVIAQALMAAYKTIEGKVCHSLNCYFMRAGDQRYPVLYEVEHSRDGRSFSTRRVMARQNGEQIFNLSASFQVVEEGLEHQEPMPAVKPPEQCPLRRTLNQVEARAATDYNWTDPKPSPARQQTWFRADGDYGEDIALHQAVLAYASDMSLLSTSLMPHGLAPAVSPLQMASLDHALWFHRPTDMNRWHLYDNDSPNASGGRGFNRGLIYREDGVLVASACQEGLIRLRR